MPGEVAKGFRQRRFFDISDRDKRDMLKLMARVAEQAYRRGVQQGAGLVRVFGALVQPLVPAVLDRWQEILLCHGIAGELVGDHHPRRAPLPLQEFAKQPLGGFRITPALNQDVEHDAVLVDGAPQPVRRPGDLDDDLIEVPLVADSRQSPPDLFREPLAKLTVPSGQYVRLPGMPENSPAGLHLRKALRSRRLISAPGTSQIPSEGVNATQPYLTSPVALPVMVMKAISWYTLRG